MPLDNSLLGLRLDAWAGAPQDSDTATSSTAVDDTLLGTTIDAEAGVPRDPGSHTAVADALTSGTVSTVDENFTRFTFDSSTGTSAACAHPVLLSVTALIPHCPAKLRAVGPP